MLLRKCRLVHLLIPTLAKHGGDDGGYEGATVIEPKKAFYNEPIATLDFASLYPSIIQGYNLCYSTLVAPSDRAKLPETAYQVTQRGTQTFCMRISLLYFFTVFVLLRIINESV
jgi:DNA polymerase delta subunit 1